MLENDVELRRMKSSREINTLTLEFVFETKGKILYLEIIKINFFALLMCVNKDWCLIWCLLFGCLKQSSSFFRNVGNGF